MKLGLVVILMSLGTLALTQKAWAQTTGWIDERHNDTKRLLGRTAHHIDDWFGQTNPDEPARASIRVMMDIHDDRHTGTTIKPRIRAKVKLPTLENRLSLIIGDDELDHEQGGGVYNDGRLHPKQDHTFDGKQSRQDNSTLALRWSKFKDDLGVQTDVDLGVRSSDVYLRWRGEKRWQMADTHGRFEQVYRYGTKSEHFALSTLEFGHPLSNSQSLINRTHLVYTHKDNDEALGWSNSLYHHHHWSGKLGMRTLDYGLYAGGDAKGDGKFLNTYGPYVSYRQPLWREWLFIQGDVGYYNNKDEDKSHHLSTFGRLELVF